MYSVFKKLNLFFLLFVVLQCNLIEAQDSDFVTGKLINAVDKTPISFATILIKNKGKGLISNNDGGFKIPVRLQKSADTLVISSIGFTSAEIPLSSLSKNTINTIVLKEKIEQLDEITVVASKKKTRWDAKDIVQLALDNIPENYPFTPFSYVGYYRDYQIKGGDYLNLNEALMQVFDSGFATSDLKDTETRIYEYKKNIVFPRDSIAAKPYNDKNGSKLISSAKISAPGGNEYTMLRLSDAIRNYNVDSYDFVKRLDLDFANNHKFKLLPDTFIDNIPLYAIDISKWVLNTRISGKIFISKGDFKIYKMEYAVYNKRESGKSKKKQSDSNVSEKKRKDLGKLLYEIILEYQSYNGIMYPNYISFNNSFESLQPPKFFTSDAKINYSIDYILTFNSLELTFNNAPLLKKAMKKRNYALLYKDKKVKIDSIEVKKNVVFLYLNKQVILDYKQLQGSSQSVYDDIKIDIENLTDVNGNELHQRDYVSYNQYREFFVQELQINAEKPMDSLFMIKNRPIFKNQAIAPFNKLSDYWMNTPLRD
ncbi:carboxypeptidase-like regulatory domain-containing protein [Algibacter sp. L4_22]|uniref:carboxypeptidase-like regulatory domain-containing protein n=1 Tax=Algibacter sp. L4_22 TaxID=2942477 RepID=UPI00201B52FB|nr:carboxypeptidase-like regulatory domain-containing protein [Algibacter sp. L4_22]MCL5129991.1 carboxypeptidase-like regulatory domain-containing protein [Algibacter sp. L4_22]